jgi:hypothetical protein
MKIVDMRHSHLNENRPYYVAVWVATDLEAIVVDMPRGI